MIVFFRVVPFTVLDREKCTRCALTFYKIPSSYRDNRLYVYKKMWTEDVIVILWSPTIPNHTRLAQISLTAAARTSDGHQHKTHQFVQYYKQPQDYHKTRGSLYVRQFSTLVSYFVQNWSVRPMQIANLWILILIFIWTFSTTKTRFY